MISLRERFANKDVSTKVFAGILTAVILALLVFSGPAQAFILGLIVDDAAPTQGDTITFTATLDIQAMDEYLPVEYLELHVDGPTSEICRFDVNGDKISGCDGMTIIPVSIPSSNDYGYGYGYGYNNGYGYNFGNGYGYGYGYGAGGSALYFEYDITLDTTDYATGDYTSWLTALIGTRTFTSDDQPAFTISAVSNDGGGGAYKRSGNVIILSPEEEPKGEGEPIELGEESKEETPQGFLAGITGAIIGTLGVGGTIAVLVFIAGITALAVTMNIVRKRKLGLQTSKKGTAKIAVLAILLVAINSWALISLL